MTDEKKPVDTPGICEPRYGVVFGKLPTMQERLDQLDKTRIPYRYKLVKIAEEGDES